MTEEQRLLIEALTARHFFTPETRSIVEAVGAALAEIGRLCGELDKARADLAATDAHLVAMYRVNDESRAAIRGYEEAESPRPAAVVRVTPASYHLFECEADAVEFWMRNRRAALEHGEYQLVGSWTWHPRKEGARGAADRETGG